MIDRRRETGQRLESSLRIGSQHRHRLLGGHEGGLDRFGHRRTAIRQQRAVSNDPGLPDRSDSGTGLALLWTPRIRGEARVAA